MNIQMILRRFLITGIFASLLVPFVVMTDLYFPFITGKAYVFRVLVEVLFGVWIILALLDKSARPKKSCILWSVLSFLAIVLVANLQGIDPRYSFWSNYERMEGYITLLHLFAYFLVVGSVINTKELWNHLWNSLIVTSVGHAIYAFLQKFGVLDVGLSADRIDGTFGNATYLGAFMLLSVFITLYLLLKENTNKIFKYFYVIAIILQVVTIFLTATRGTIIAVLIGIPVAIIISLILEPQKKYLRYGVAGIGVALILFTTLIVGFKESDIVQSNVALRRMSQISLDSGTVLARFINWGIAWQAVENRPLLGYGQGNYGPIFDVNYDVRMWNQEQWFDRVHNIFLDWLVAAGFFGLISYLSIFAVLIYYIWSKDRNFSNAFKASVTAMIVAYFIHNIFVFDNLTSYMILFLVLAFVHSEVSSHFKFCENKVFSNKIIILVSVLILIAIPGVVWRVNADSYLQNKEMLKAIKPASIDEIDKSISIFKNALDRNTFGNTETRMQLIVFTSKALRVQGGSLEKKQQLVDFSMLEIKKHIEMHPNDSKFLVMSGQLIAQTGNLELAKGFFEKAIGISPKKQFMYSPLVELLFQQGKKDEAFTLIKKVYEMETDNDTIWGQYVKSALRVGDQKLYKELIDEAYATNRGYRVVNLAEENLKSKPNEVQSYASLAVAYYRDGNSEKAIELLNTLKEKFPEGKSQADMIISKIQLGESIF